jgi:hypothetical protein
MTWTRITDKQTGEEQFVASLAGVDLDLYTIEELDGEPVELVQEEKRAALDALLEAKDTGLCMTPINPVPVSLEEKVKSKILGALWMCRLKEEINEPFEVNFTLCDESRVTLNNTTLRQLAAAVGAYVVALHDHADALRQAINEATTIADLDAIDITVGWP